MFKKKTVFILGAGASWHYGYPTGEELVSMVIATAETLCKYFTVGYQNQSGSVPQYALRTLKEGAYPISTSVWSNAAEECIKLARRLKEVNPTLIDYFLAQNADLHDIGRLVIALVIFRCEAEYHKAGGNPNHRSLQRTRIGRGDSTVDPNKLDLSAFKDDWLRFVLYSLTVRCPSSLDIGKNAVSFISFNYDTSLEHRLYMGLTNISHFERQHAAEFINPDRFLHVYGKVRERIDDKWLPLEIGIPQNYNDTFHNYKVVLDQVFEASKGIRTIDGDDKVANEEILMNARKLIGEAEVVYVLGFGFDASNVERLQLKELAPHPVREPAHSVYFTNFRGLDSVSMAAARTLVGSPNTFLSGNPQTYETPVHLDGIDLYYRYQMSTKNVYDAIAEDFESMGTN